MRPTKKQKEQAQDIMEKHGHDALYVNKKGEFFTSKNLALNSVKMEEQHIALIEKSEAVADEPKEEATAEQDEKKEDKS
ncbi:hypothetical protein [Algivirga pacifica]|uniref:Uncharacterized protein n=1 Tax=Algivirga pacifica TaxID=1162670 RepID=A0ABP9D8T6_9BACT